MKTRIDQIKSIKPGDQYRSLHGNRKMIGKLTVAEYIEIAGKKTDRYTRSLNNNLTIFDIVRSLLKYCSGAKGTSYFKVMIEGHSGIYLASPLYGHSDYNKTRLFDKNDKTLKIMQIFNKLINK